MVIYNPFSILVLVFIGCILTVTLYGYSQLEILKILVSAPFFFFFFFCTFYIILFQYI
ncbi:hypothetical protein H8356DRAFT_1617323 [Neocallimastix lanati (nom. inval.)]|nr:hypothetical protein H8356DRAFT_1617323 [Neocallimastix sp. JGI-2020a]